MIEIEPRRPRDAHVSVPGSKSHSHRALIASALSDGVCRVRNALDSEDTRFTRDGLRRMGVRIEEKEGGAVTVYGTGGVLEPSDKPVYLGNSGTSMRLLTGIAALGKGTYRLTGTERMHERSIGDLLDGLKQIGVHARSVNGNGCPPVDVTGGRIVGGRVKLSCRVSSQYLTSLLLMAPYTEKGLTIDVTQGPVSKPYIDMTVEIMERMGVPVERDGYTRFRVSGGQRYRHGEYAVEADCSQAGYFWAAGAVTGARIKVLDVSLSSTQGDVRFCMVLETMGCRVFSEPDGIAVQGGPLKGIDVDMGDMPDMVPTLAVVAAFADGETVIRNVAHLRVKESDRLSAVACELGRIGVDARVTEDGLRIRGAGGRVHSPQGGGKIEIETYNDHRIAMSFAVAGLMIPGVCITNEGCVEKSFPEFWRVFDSLVGSSRTLTLY